MTSNLKPKLNIPILCINKRNKTLYNANKISSNIVHLNGRQRKIETWQKSRRDRFHIRKYTTGSTGYIIHITFYSIALWIFSSENIHKNLKF